MKKATLFFVLSILLPFVYVGYTKIKIGNLIANNAQIKNIATAKNPSKPTLLPPFQHIVNATTRNLSIANGSVSSISSIGAYRIVNDTLYIEQDNIEDYSNYNKITVSHTIKSINNRDHATDVRLSYYKQNRKLVIYGGNITSGNDIDTLVVYK